MNNKSLYKTLIIVTAFILLGAGLQLSFKKNSVLTQALATRQNAAAASSTSTTTDPNKIDLSKASQATGLPLEQLKSIVSQLTNNSSPLNADGCVSSINGVKVYPKFGSCKPPGPGRFTGNIFGTGQDMQPCVSEGIKGGGIVAMCWQGCCRAFSVTNSKKAFDLANLSPEQMIELGLKGLGLLSQFGQSGYSGVSGYNNDVYLGVDGTDTGFGDYFTDTDTTGTVYDFDTYSYNDTNPSDTFTQPVFKTIALTDKQNVNKDKVKVDLIKNSPDILDKPAVVTVPDLSAESDFAVADIAQDDTRYLEFQELSNSTVKDPRLDDLRNPESSSVRQSLSNRPEVQYESQNDRDKRGILQIIIDIITSPFK